MEAEGDGDGYAQGMMIGVVHALQNQVGIGACKTSRTGRPEHIYRL